MAIIFPPIIDTSITAFVCNFNEQQQTENFAIDAYGQEIPLRIYFAFQSLTATNSNKIINLVLVKAQESGKSIWQTGATYEPFEVHLDTTISADNINKQRYYIEITSNMIKSLRANSHINFQLLAISRNIEQLSRDWLGELSARARQISIIEEDLGDNPADAFVSEVDLISNDPDNPVPFRSRDSVSVAFYPIYSPVFNVYGGLSQEQVQEVGSLYQQDQITYRLASTKLLQEEQSLGLGHHVTPTHNYIIKGSLAFGILDPTLSEPNLEQETLFNTIERDLLVGFEVVLKGKYNTSNTTRILDNNISVTGVQDDVIVTSTNGVEYIDKYWDGKRKSFKYTLNYSFLDNYDYYELWVSYYTNKGYKQTFMYPLDKQSSDIIDDDTDEVKRTDLFFTSLRALSAPTKGAISLRAAIKYEKEVDGPDNYAGDGVIIIDRAVIDKYDFAAQREPDETRERAYAFNKLRMENLQFTTCYTGTWKFSLSNAASIEYQYDDISVEPGVFYVYRIQYRMGNPDTGYTYASFENSDKPYTTIEQPCILFIEDMFLSTRDMTLKIRYNPELSGLKRNTVDIITPTLGGSYPFVRRNGAQKYRTFNIGGLISYNSELYESNTWELSNYMPIDIHNMENVSTLTLEENRFYNSLFVRPNFINTEKYDAWVANGYLSKEEQRMVYEKLFRDLVMDFLYKDHILLFKSQPEGNMFIRLSNVSFTPNKQLDRHIYTFTATATEVLETTLANYLEQLSNDYSDGISSTLIDVFALAGTYQYSHAADSFYVGTDSGQEQTPSVNINNTTPIVEHMWTWNIEDANWESETIGDKDIVVGTAVTQTKDTWGVPLAQDKTLPQIISETVIPDIHTAQELQYGEFDLLISQYENEYKKED